MVAGAGGGAGLGEELEVMRREGNEREERQNGKLDKIDKLEMQNEALQRQNQRS